MLRSTPDLWKKKSLASHALLPLAAAYRVCSLLRNALTFPRSVSVPVICIGNAVAGGAGKTPVALYVAEVLRAQGKNPCFLSRGYKGSLEGPVLVDVTKHSAQEVGDEPRLLARACPTVVSKNRVRGASFAQAQGADVIVMDDGFQNPTLYKNFSILVVDGSYRFGNGRVLPAGPLREPVESALLRADAVLVMDGSIDTGHVPVFHGTLMPDVRSTALKGMRIMGFAGIAHPEKFLRTLEKIGCDVVDFFPYPDHYMYPDTTLESLIKRAESEGAQLLTTAKDWVRIPPRLQDAIQAVEVELHVAEAQSLAALLEKAVGT